ncbi:PREDICTED: uncharacterized protein LOC109158395 [Ipomoea nil]|uniref:uncharacterized protein LOC109158395 n=1 Tax=Ipomoea nil TaxID=35883 RepID=UPI0009015DB4|nr:PREDICTED: uncharacterized protein LOC109158395 [Ipomoea nil]
MVKDCRDYARRCQACQYHANFIHQPPKPLYPTVASWPFDAWGLDVVGLITPSHLQDNGKPFDNKLMDKICKLFDFKQRNSSAYYAAANGLVEAFNKTLCNLLKKVV